MATNQPTITTINDTFTEFKDNLNTVSLDLGATGRLNTTIDSDVVGAINELDSDLHGSGGGDVVADLTATSYSSVSVRDGGLVGAVNAIDAFIGDDSDTLSTTAKTIVDAIVELDVDLHGAGGGNAASDLNTTANDVVSAINEIEGVFDASNTSITAGSTFDVTVSGSNQHFIVDATGHIDLDADAGIIYFRDDGTEFGRLENSSGQVHIYSNGQKFLEGSNTNASFKNNLTVDNTLNVTGVSNLNGNVNLGNANTDNIVFNGDVNSSIEPNTDNAFDLGSPTQEWRHIYADGTVYGDNIDGDSATLANFNINTNTISNANSVTIDAGTDISLDADGGDVFLKDAGTQYGALTNTSGNLIVKSGTTTALTFSGANVTTGGTVTTGGNVTMGGTTIQRTGVLTFDASSNINIDAGGGNIYLKDDGTQFGNLKNTSGNLIIQSGNTTAVTFSGANATFAGTVNVGALNTTASDVRAAINEHEADLGTMSLNTSASNVTAAINELHTTIGTQAYLDSDGVNNNLASNNIGLALFNLDSSIGNLASLDATDVSDRRNLVFAINALGADIAQLDSDNTAFSSRVGSLASLDAGFTGAERNSVVNALNALYNAIPEIYDDTGTLLN